MRQFAIVMLFLAGALFSPARSALRAAVIDWINPAGGTFSDGANWQGGKAPTATDDAVFDNNAEYVVSFDADASTSGLWIGTDNVTLQLNGNTYYSGDTSNPTFLGIDTTDVAQLRVLNGTLKAGRVRVGDPSGAEGYLQVGKAATLNIPDSKVASFGVPNGELSVIDGGRVVGDANSQISVGVRELSFAPSSMGTLVVDGTGSSVSADSINLSVGSVSVRAGGAIAGISIGLRRNDLDFDSYAIATGVNTKITASGVLNVGGTTFTIDDQATVQALDFHITSGQEEAKFTQGVVVVSDSAQLTVADDFTIGGTLIPGDGTVIPGKGTLKVVEAGKFTSNSALIAGANGTVGLVEVDGVGSTWENLADISVGHNGYGKLVVSNGGQVTSGAASSFASSIGHGIPSQGEVVVTDPGSSWQILSPLYVGHLGKGSLTVQNGASVSTESTILGHFVVATGEALVTGANSIWTNSGELSVGGDPNAFGGTGELEIADGGLVKVGATATVWKTSALHLDDGTLQATSINIAGGSLSGVGTLIGNLINTGEISPGNSPGTLKVQGDYTQSLGGLLKLEIGSTAVDLLQVTGNAKLGGTLQLNLLGGFSPADGTTYDLLTANSLSGAFDTLLLPDLGPGRSWQFNYGADRVSITAVPEPSTMVLAALGAMACAAVAMRRRITTSP